MKAVLRDWAKDDDIWKRRTAILAQLRARGETDTALLADAIRPSIGDPEFFLRKGIGWALREYSKTDPAWVLEFVGAHPGLSVLTGGTCSSILQPGTGTPAGPTLRAGLNEATPLMCRKHDDRRRHDSGNSPAMAAVSARRSWPFTAALPHDVPTAAAGPGGPMKSCRGMRQQHDITTRIGWYSKASACTGRGAAVAFDEGDAADAGWSGVALAFPRIQGADCCGRIVATGEGVDRGRIGARVIVRSMMRSPVGHRPFECWTFGSECDGAFAQYAVASDAEAYAVDCDWTDAEHGVDPCAWSTRRTLLQPGRRSGGARCS